MNKKLLTIQVLKQRITNMQQDLNRLEKEAPTPKRSVSKSRSQDNSASPIRKTTTNKRYKSPTFWTGNPLIGQQNPYFAPKNLSPSKKVPRINSFVNRSPIQQKIIKEVDLSYYQSAPQYRTPEKQNFLNYESVKAQKKYNFTKKSPNEVFQLMRSIRKVQKVKTFDLPKKDPILNPEPPKISSKKITNPQCRSPKNIFTENPNSNPNLYFNLGQPVTLSPKGYNNRNKSQGIKLLLSNSLQNLGSHKLTPKQSGKRHYTRYFQDNFQSKWMMQW